MSSWDKSDSKGDTIGDIDMDLCKRLTRAGVEHRTFLRMMIVWMDVTAPLYLWKEFDRYTVGKTQVSTSTMHTIHKKEFTLDDFSTDRMSDRMVASLQALIEDLNISRRQYLENKDKRDWWDMIQILPTSYNQKRTVMMSYEVCLKIIKERHDHRLDEWQEFCWALRRLPYMEQFVSCL
jgi:hypothetical protein